MWAQINHHTEQVNQQLIKNLNALVESEDFLKEIEEMSAGGDDGEDVHEYGEE